MDSVDCNAIFHCDGCTKKKEEDGSIIKSPSLGLRQLENQKRPISTSASKPQKEHICDRCGKSFGSTYNLKVALLYFYTMPVLVLLKVKCKTH